MRRAKGGASSGSSKKKRRSDARRSASLPFGAITSAGRGAALEQRNRKNGRAPPLRPCTRHCAAPPACSRPAVSRRRAAAQRFRSGLPLRRRRTIERTNGVLPPQGRRRVATEAVTPAGRAIGYTLAVYWNVRRTLAIAACAGVLVQAASDRRAVAQPPLPPALRDLLTRFGGTAWNGQRLLFGDLLPPMPGTVEKNPALADLMARACREDVVVPPTHGLFSTEMIAVGLWQSQFFLDSYGSALLLARPYTDDRVAIVLVHGINGSPRDFADLVERLDGSSYQPVAFYYPTGMPLADAGRQLGARLEEFRLRHPGASLAIVGHSMGGLVVKAMLDQHSSAELLASSEVVVSLATPWNGIEAARYANRLPRRPPAWDDLAPTSQFIKQLHDTPFPAHLPFYLFFGARSSSRLLGALGNNDGVLTLDSVLASPLSRAARDIFGFYEDHVSILSAPAVFRRLEQVLDGEVDGDADAALKTLSVVRFPSR